VVLGAVVEYKTKPWTPLDVSITQQGEITKMKITLHSRGNEDTN
jgi:hypothetical protein